MFKFRFFLLILTSFILSNSIFASVWYVTPTGGDVSLLQGTSWANATSDLQLIINKSVSGDEIWVAAGTYYPGYIAGYGTTNRDKAFVLKSGVKIYGGFGGTETQLSQRNWTTNVTILSGDLGTVGNTSDNAYHVVVSAGVDGTAELNGFTISNGNANADATITVNSKTITSSWGGGVFCISSSPTLTNLIIQSNSAMRYGGGMYILDSSPTISSVIIDSNSVAQGGGGIYIEGYSALTMTNIIVRNNSVTDNNWANGGGIYNKNNSAAILTIINALIYKNTSNGGGAGIYSTGSVPTLINTTIVYNTAINAAAGGIEGGAIVKNSIIWGNKGANTTNNVSGSFTYSYTLLDGGTLSGTSIISTSNPTFTDISTDNYHLKRLSPIVNKGLNSLNSSSTDLDGNPRIFDLGNGGVIDLGAYEYQSADATVSPFTNGIMYVKKGATGDGTSWTNALGELSDAISTANGSTFVSQIWVAAGTYYPGYIAGNGTTDRDKAFVLPNNIKIYGGFAGTESSVDSRNLKSNPSILSGDLGTLGNTADNAYHVVISSGTVGTAELNGFTISDGRATNGVTPTVNSNTVSSGWGGGIYCVNSSPILSNLIIKSNYADYKGGGIYNINNSSPTLTNVLICNNNSGQDGTGIFIDSGTPTIINSTIVSNTAAGGSCGGIYGNCTVKNSIIWGNTSSNVNGSITYSNTLLQGGIVSSSSIISNSDPKFANSSIGDYHLSLLSPARNVGNNTYISGVTTDLDGYGRIQNGIVDLGAYETINEWVGSTSTNWETATNWSFNSVPTNGEDLKFSATAVNDLVQSQTHVVNNIYNPGSKVLNLNGHQLSITGAVTLSTNGTINASATNSTVIYAGTSAQTIGSEFLADGAYNLTIDNAAGVTVNTDFTINNLLTINTGKLLTIPASKKLNVIGSITNNAGASGLVIKSGVGVANGTLIFHNAVGNPVSATVEMYSKAAATYTSPYSGYKWQFFGIPVRALTKQDAFSSSYVRRFDETVSSGSSWISLTNTDVLTSFKGYEITQDVAKTIIFQGVLENRDMNCNLTCTSGSIYNGQQIISNPYTAAIDIKQLTFSNNMNASVYLYNTGSHADWTANSGSTSPTTTPGQYVVSTKETAGSGGVPDQIPSMQGFMVTAASGGSTLSFPYSILGSSVKNTSLQRVKQSTPENKIYTIIDVKGAKYSDRMWLFTDNACTHNFDNGWDGYKILGSTSAPQIYATEADGDYQIDAVDNINNTYLGFQTGEDREYTMTFTHQNFGSKYTTLYLTDLLTNKSTDISQSGSTYTFTSDVGSPLEKRFKITTSVDLHTQLDQTTTNPLTLKVYNLNQTICIANNTPQSGELTIYDMAGKVVAKSQFSPNNVTRIKTNIKSGYYLARARILTGSSIVKLFIP